MTWRAIGIQIYVLLIHKFLYVVLALIARSTEELLKHGEDGVQKDPNISAQPTREGPKLKKTLLI